MTSTLIALPEITVVLPVYNGAKYLKQSIDSVLNQNIDNFLLLICDDSSTDESWEIIASYKDKRISAVKNEKNSGLFKTLNSLCRKVKTPLIKLWTQDDVMNEHCLRECVAFHRKYPQISFSYSAMEIIDESGKVITQPFDDRTPELIPRQLHDKIALYTGSIAGNISNVTIVKATLQDVGYFDENMTISGDFDMWVKLTENYDIGRISLPLVKVRSHDGQLSRSADYYLMHLIEDRQVYKRLLMRVDDRHREFGRQHLKWIKRPLYFSFMLLTLRKGKIKTARKFYRELSKDEAIPALFARWAYLKIRRILGVKSATDNSFLFKDEKLVKTNVLPMPASNRSSNNMLKNQLKKARF